jgi:metallo-beta-lactamase class B
MKEQVRTGLDRLKPRAVEIAQGVWRVGGGSWGGAVAAMSEEADANVYLLRVDGADILVDCGTRAGRDEVSRNLLNLGCDPDALSDLLLTHSHWDHTDAAAEWQAALPAMQTHLNSIGAAFLAQADHRLVGYQLQEPTYAFQPFRVDHEVMDRETFDLGGARITARFLPGHSPDSTIYTFELDGRVIGISGDVMFAPRVGQNAVLGRLCTLWLSNLDDYVASLRLLADLQIDVLLPGLRPRRRRQSPCRRRPTQHPRTGRIAGHR